MTNYEYIISHLTERDMACLFKSVWSAVNCGIDYSKEASSNSVLRKVYDAYHKFADTFSDAYHHGNIYQEDAEKQPNVYLWGRVHDKDCNEWKSYGHGRMIGFQIWLESPFVPEHWGINPQDHPCASPDSHAAHDGQPKT